MIFDTKIAGIPCQCKITFFSPYRPMKIYGPGMGDAHPPEYEELSFQILDQKGYPAPWLEKKITPKDQERLREEFHLEHTGERYGYL